jgi:hypothetical protein
MIVSCAVAIIMSCAKPPLDRAQSLKGSIRPCTKPPLARTTSPH